ncbi:MAG: signal peptide peptidase SppA [Phycisphaerales bacterium]|nr:signal peptide peptidase SppA [Phycisphaerales bacterium]
MRVILSLLAACLLWGCGPTTLVVGVTPGDQYLQATRVIAGQGWWPDRVAMIDVTGLLLSTNQTGLLSEGDNPLSDLAEKLQAARNDVRVKAVILRINSPGGTVTASDAMYRELLRFREQTGKPVVVLMMDVAASGGYYLACAADHIVAYPTTITGSVGVIAQTVSIKSGLSMIGIHSEAFTSGPNKDAGSPLADMSDSHRQVFRSMIDDFYQRFAGIVKQHRTGIPADKFTWATDGRIVTGTQALEVGLVDELGDLHSTFARAQQLAQISNAELIVYHRPLRYVGSPYALAATDGMAGNSARGVTVNLAQINLPEFMQGGSSGFYYLWSGTGH